MLSGRTPSALELDAVRHPVASGADLPHFESNRLRGHLLPPSHIAIDTCFCDCRKAIFFCRPNTGHAVPWLFWRNLDAAACSCFGLALLFEHLDFPCVYADPPITSVEDRSNN